MLQYATIFRERSRWKHGHSDLGRWSMHAGGRFNEDISAKPGACKRVQFAVRSAPVYAHTYT